LSEMADCRCIVRFLVLSSTNRITSQRATRSNDRAAVVVAVADGKQSIFHQGDLK
jgi:hypothetical protein